MGWDEREPLGAPRLPGSLGTRAPPATGVASGPHVLLPQHELVSAIFRALMCSELDDGASSGAWSFDGQSAVCLQRIGLHAVKVRLEAAHAGDARSALRMVSPLMLDILPFLLTCDEGGQNRTHLVIRSSDVLKAKGSRRWGEERRALVGQIADQVQVLRRLSVGGELLFKLTPIDGEAFVYEPQAWLRELQARPARRELDLRILQLDHRSNRGPDVLAKKIAIHLSLSMGGSPGVRSVRSILRAVGEAEADLASRQGRGGRLAERFDEALLRLQEHGLFAVRYRGSDEAANDRNKGWIKAWLERDVAVTPAAYAAPLALALAQRTAADEARANPPPAALPPAMIKALR